ncbi:MAG TPA: malto-oligosyltrehalose trehalohydrolase [Candidatus Sulfotelmatobacter sp.]|nr:malto-oligosyltrehalose trehalohydrolase [Candidatus Sulfotelmatobacter sp.]
MKRSSGMPFGAEVRDDGGVRFRLWAPKAVRVDLVLEDAGPSAIPLTKIDGGWFELVTAKATIGSRYRYLINGELKVPDPASRFQPDDVHGPSEVIDPRSFDWQDSSWAGRAWEEAIIYELHVGAFTREGTFHGVEQKLGHLRELGVTAIELMPLADFSGARNWGYDGVLPFAPDSSYGRPEDLKQLVQAAHSTGLMVFLDVVYNHFGPEGNYLHAYSPEFFTSRHHTPWGDAINFDGVGSPVVREFFIHNALYWLEEFHFDGLRLDAVHEIADDSRPNILTELAQTVRRKFADRRQVHLILENVDNASRYLARDQRNQAELYDAQWDDDLHHALHVVLTDESDGYYSDYSKSPMRQLCRCLTEGFAYQGDYSEFHCANRGEISSHLPPTAFISFLQNHDQVGNRALGERITELVPARSLQAAVEILLLAPSPPMLFMGEEFGATTPFLFFCDFHGDLALAVTQGRRNEFARFTRFRSPELRDEIPDPNAEQTFLSSKLDWSEVKGGAHEQWLELYRKLLVTRRRFIEPLLRQTSKVCVNICDDASRALSIDWDFADGPRLELRANLGGAPANRAMHQTGSVIYEAGSADADGMAPWSVRWSLRR